MSDSDDWEAEKLLRAKMRERLIALGIRVDDAMDAPPPESGGARGRMGLKAEARERLETLINANVREATGASVDMRSYVRQLATECFLVRLQDIAGRAPESELELMELSFWWAFSNGLLTLLVRDPPKGGRPMHS